MRAHQNLLRLAGPERDVGRKNLEAINAHVLQLRTRRASGNPFGEHFVFERVGGELLPALVRNGPRGLEHEQAAARITGHDTAAHGVASQREVVAFVVVAAQGKAKAVLARRRAVARAGTAPELRQHRLHMVAETPVERLGHAAHQDVGPGRVATGFGPNRGPAIADRNRHAVFNPHHIRIAGNKLDRIRDLTGQLFSRNALDDQRLARGRAVEGDAFGDDDERSRLGGQWEQGKAQSEHPRHRRSSGEAD